MENDKENDKENIESEPVIEEKEEKIETKSSQKDVNVKVDSDITFDFFYDLVKKLILKRCDVGDVCTLSSWLKALEQKSNTSIRNEYIKLMVLALQHSEPMCPFKDPPPEIIDPLENGVIEMARKFIRGEGTATCVGPDEMSENQSYPSISTSVSQDKCRYASYQVIPNVGVQCYYAYSDDHLYNWNLPPQLSAPKDGPHSRDVDWERAMAGIHPEPPKSTVDNKDALENRDEKKKDNFRGRDKQELCNVMYIEQQNRNVTEEFGWNDASLLTGEMILGAEMLSDQKMEAQMKTQVELDEEVSSCHDKLYEGDFKILVDPVILDGITIPEKKRVVLETVGKNANAPGAPKSDGQRTTCEGQPGFRQRAGREDHVESIENPHNAADEEISKMPKKGGTEDAGMCDCF